MHDILHCPNFLVIWQANQPSVISVFRLKPVYLCNHLASVFFQGFFLCFYVVKEIVYFLHQTSLDVSIPESKRIFHPPARFQTALLFYKRRNPFLSPRAARDSAPIARFNTLLFTFDLSFVQHQLGYRIAAAPNFADGIFPQPYLLLFFIFDSHRRIFPLFSMLAFQNYLQVG